MKKIIHRANSIKYKYFVSLALLGLSLTYLLAISISFNEDDDVALLDPPASTEASEIKPEFNKEELIIKKNSSLYESLTKAGLTGVQVAKIVSDTKPVYNFSYISAGTEYTLFKDDEDQVRKISFKLSELSHLVITEYNDGWVPEIVNVPTTKSTVHFSGKVTDNLWNSGIRAGLPPLFHVVDRTIFLFFVQGI